MDFAFGKVIFPTNIKVRKGYFLKNEVFYFVNFVFCVGNFFWFYLIFAALWQMKPTILMKSSRIARNTDIFSLPVKFMTG